MGFRTCEENKKIVGKNPEKELNRRGKTESF